MTVEMNITRDAQSAVTYALPFSDLNYTARIVADTDTTVSVPANVRFALVSAEDFFFVSDSVITLPVLGGGFSAADGEQAKEIINVEDVATLHVRSRNPLDISISFYS